MSCVFLKRNEESFSSGRLTGLVDGSIEIVAAASMVDGRVIRLKCRYQTSGEPTDASRGIN
jgi:hypothetical protein